MADTKNDKNSNSPALRFPGFTEPWKPVTLGDITFNFSRRNKECKEYPMYSVTNHRGFVPQNEQFEDREMVGEDIKSYKIIEYGEFAYNPARINVGSIARYIGSEPCMISSLYVCFKPSNEIDGSFLMQFLKSPKANFYYNANGEGGVRIYLFYPNFARIRTAIPSLSEQRKISSLLSIIDERITTQRRLIEDLEKLKSSINETLYVSLATDYKISFYEIGSDYAGLTGKSAEDFGVGKPFISYLNVYQNQVITDCNFDYVEIRDGENQNKVQKGDLLFTLSSETPEEIGYSAVYMGDANELYLNSFCFGIHIPESKIVYPPYMGYLTSTSYFRRKIIPYAQGSTRFNLHKPSLMNMKFSLPAKENQKKIFIMLQLIVEKIYTEKEILSNLTHQRNYLLTRLFI